MSDKKPCISKEILEDKIRAIASEYRKLKEPLTDSDREFKIQLHIAYQMLMKDYHKYFVNKKDENN